MSSTHTAGATAPTRARRRPAPGQATGRGRSTGSSPAPDRPTTAPPSPIAALDPADWPDLSDVVTEDDQPVDNIFSEKQQRLLTETLYSSWPGPGDGRPFLALANVGLFFAVGRPPLVPDMMLSVDVSAPDEVWTKAHRSYFVWVYGKPPDVVIEVVSNDEGGEDGRKLAEYARIGIPHYVIFDPERHLGPELLRVYRLEGGVYQRAADGTLPRLGLSLDLWSGAYEQIQETWLRWFDAEGRPLPTGAERAEAAESDAARTKRAAAADVADAAGLAAAAANRAALAEGRAADAEARAAALAERLRSLGVDPETP